MNSGNQCLGLFILFHMVENPEKGTGIDARVLHHYSTILNIFRLSPSFGDFVARAMLRNSETDFFFNLNFLKRNTIVFNNFIIKSTIVFFLIQNLKICSMVAQIPLLCTLCKIDSNGRLLLYEILCSIMEVGISLAFTCENSLLS